MKSSKKKEKKIQYGKIDLPDGAFENGKFRVTMFVPLDVLDEVRKRAKKQDLPYQTYINQVLREHVFGSRWEEKIREVVREELAKKAS